MDNTTDEVKGLKKAIKRLTEFFEGTGARPGVAPAADFKTELADALKPFEQKFSDMEKKLEDEKKAREAAESKINAQGQTTFAEIQIRKLKDAGRWIPAFEKMGVPAVFSELAKSQTKVTFGDGDKKQEKHVGEVLTDFLLALPKFVPAGQISMSESATRVTGKLIQFTEPDDGRTAVIEGSLEMAEAATALAAKDKISYGEALKIVRRSGQYAPTGGSAAGAV